MINKLVTEIINVINSSRNEAIRSVNFARVLMYHNIGRIIVTELQDNSDRADYGSYLLKDISEIIIPEFGNGFSVRILELSRQFYRIFPITNALHSQLNWTQYRLLIAIDNNKKIRLSHELSRIIKKLTRIRLVFRPLPNWERGHLARP